MKSSVMFTTHYGPIGGGEYYIASMANVLAKYSDFRLFRQNFDTELGKHHAIEYSPFFPITSFISNPDLFISASHFVAYPSQGKENYLLVFFPNPRWKEIVKQYDRIVTISQYSAQWIEEYWDRKTTVILPPLDQKQFYIGDKAKHSILGVSRFFRENDGHSKNQHVLIEAFKDLLHEVPDATLRLAGASFPEDSGYLDYCVAISEGLEDRIRFYPNCSFNELKKLYSVSDVFWHANGYGRTDPAQVEHFGIVIAEAMASGCSPVVYMSGGWNEFIGVYPWKEIDELIENTLEIFDKPSDLESLRKFTEPFSIEEFERNVRKCFGV